MASADKKTDIDQEIADIRAILDTLPRSANGRRYGINNELRMRIVELKRASGLSGVEFSEAIGLGYNLFVKWQRRIPYERPEASSQPRFARVQVSAGTGPNQASGSREDLIHIEGPLGLKFSMNGTQLAGFLRRFA